MLYVTSLAEFIGEHLGICKNLCHLCQIESSFSELEKIRSSINFANTQKQNEDPIAKEKALQIISTI